MQPARLLFCGSDRTAFCSNGNDNMSTTFFHCYMVGVLVLIGLLHFLINMVGSKNRYHQLERMKTLTCPVDDPIIKPVQASTAKENEHRLLDKNITGVRKTGKWWASFALYSISVSSYKFLSCRSFLFFRALCLNLCKQHLVSVQWIWMLILYFFKSTMFVVHSEFCTQLSCILWLFYEVYLVEALRSCWSESAVKITLHFNLITRIWNRCVISRLYCWKLDKFVDQFTKIFCLCFSYDWVYLQYPLMINV